MKIRGSYFETDFKIRSDNKKCIKATGNYNKLQVFLVHSVGKSLYLALSYRVILTLKS